MEETPEWLDEDEHADDLGEEATAEEEWGEEEEEEDVPLPEDTKVEEEIHLPCNEPRHHLHVDSELQLDKDLGTIGIGRRQSTLLLGSSSLARAARVAGASTPSSSRVPPDHPLLPEEEWCPLPVKGVGGIDDLDSYDIIFIVLCTI